MAGHKSLHGYTTFFVLFSFAIIKHGVSQVDEYDYLANITVEEVKSSKNEFFEVDGKVPDATLKIIKVIETGDRVYLVDYSVDHDGEVVQLDTISLCEQLAQNETSAELREQIFFKFLFPSQRTCPVQQESSKVPGDKMNMYFKFEYLITSNLTCKPWKYVQELRTFSSKEPLLSITVNLEMEKKFKCDPVEEFTGKSEDDS